MNAYVGRVTLNLTVLTRQTIYQAADFRLTEFDTGKIVTDSSDKLVVLEFRSWSGFVTYTGVGALGKRSIATYVTAWLRGHQGLTMAQVAAVLADRGGQLMGHVTPARPHTFILAGFAKGHTRTYVVSNFEKWEGARSSTPSSAFTVTSVSSKSTPKVIVTGCKPAVPRSRRKRLERLIGERVQDSAYIRHILQEEIRLAADSLAAGNKVSRDSVVHSFDSSGSGRADRSGSTVGIAPMLLEGMDVSALVEEVAKRAVGTAAVSGRLLWSGRSGGDALARRKGCSALTVESEDSTGALRELSGLGGDIAFARAVNLHGAAVGECNLTPRPNAARHVGQ